MQHAHPAAPDELKKSFGEFLKKFQSPARTNGDGSSPGAHAYQEYWEAPSKYWNGRMKSISEEEIDAVLVSFYHSLRLPAHSSFPERRSDTALDYVSSLRRQQQQYDTHFFNPFPHTRASVSPPPLRPSLATAPFVQPPHPRCPTQSRSQLPPA